MQNILIATHNPHKTGEIQAILGNQFQVSDLIGHPEIPATIETGATLQENAVLKAIEATRYFKSLVLSDDSGLEVDALNGAPGVRSARYAGENADDKKNREYLLEQLEKSGLAERSARFRCVIALAQNEKIIEIFEGTVNGVIIDEPKGEGGFGYDSLFLPDGYCQTFAQLPAKVKNCESHRAQALEKVCVFLRSHSLLVLLMTCGSIVMFNCFILSVF